MRDSIRATKSERYRKRWVIEIDPITLELVGSITWNWSEIWLVNWIGLDL